MTKSHFSLCPVKTHADAGYSPMGSCQCVLIAEVRSRVGILALKFTTEHDVWDDEELFELIVAGEI